MIAKVDKSDFSFTIDTIDNSDFIPELKSCWSSNQKLIHQAYFYYKLKKIYLCLVVAKRWWQKMTVNNMQKQNMPKQSTVKKRKTGQQLSIESAFANAVHDPSEFRQILVMMRMTISIYSSYNTTYRFNILGITVQCMYVYCIYPLLF
jgi:hypothetical protein